MAWVDSASRRRISLRRPSWRATKRWTCVCLRAFSRSCGETAPFYFSFRIFLRQNPEIFTGILAALPTYLRLHHGREGRKSSPVKVSRCVVGGIGVLFMSFNSNKRIAPTRLFCACWDHFLVFTALPGADVMSGIFYLRLRCFKAFVLFSAPDLGWFSEPCLI